MDDILDVVRRAEEEVQELKRLFGKPRCARCGAEFDHAYELDYHIYREH